MKRHLMILAFSVACLAQSQAALYFDWNSGFTGGGVIPSDSSGWWDTRNLTGITGVPTRLSVRLQLTEALPEGNNGDLYAYLSHNGVLVVLLNRVGRTAANPDGYLDPGMNITLSDTAATDVHFYGGAGFTVLAGSFQPDGRDLDPTSSGAAFDAASRQNGGQPLSLLSSLNPNGDWTLFLSDQGASGQSTLASWGLTLETSDPVPEPAPLCCALMATFLTVALGLRQRRQRLSRLAMRM